MSKYLISACLVGEYVRYDGHHSLQPKIKALLETGQAITICPEIAGGLNTPRPAAEIIAGDGHHVLQGTAQVINIFAEDLSDAFIRGAQKTLQLAQQHQVSHVILKANSPSCGSKSIYDGSFTNHKIHADGVTAALLKQHGFEVFTEIEWLDYLTQDVNNQP